MVGPTFNVSVTEIDFGRVAYGFVNSKFITLINTSPVRQLNTVSFIINNHCLLHFINLTQIPMVFSLRVPGDSTHRPEFEIDPARGAIAPRSELRVQVNLLPTFQQLFVLHCMNKFNYPCI